LGRTYVEFASALTSRSVAAAVAMPLCEASVASTTVTSSSREKNVALIVVDLVDLWRPRRQPNRRLDRAWALIDLMCRCRVVRIDRVERRLALRLKSRLGQQRRALSMQISARAIGVVSKEVLRHCPICLSANDVAGPKS
jgi:hypothetical protein